MPQNRGRRWPAKRDASATVAGHTVAGISRLASRHKKTKNDRSALANLPEVVFDCSAQLEIQPMGRGHDKVKVEVEVEVQVEVRMAIT